MSNIVWRSDDWRWETDRHRLLQSGVMMKILTCEIIYTDEKTNPVLNLITLFSHLAHALVLRRLGKRYYTNYLVMQTNIIAKDSITFYQSVTPPCPLYKNVLIQTARVTRGPRFNQFVANNFATSNIYQNIRKKSPTDRFEMCDQHFYGQWRYLIVWSIKMYCAGEKQATAKK